jgi:PIN domain nuclease of toxin-antitoxin system
MRLLLDTHVFLWLLLDDPKLPADVRAAAVDPANELSVIAVSVWEAVIKHAIGKLVLPSPAVEYLVNGRERHGFAALSLDEGALFCLAGLPHLHRDPFDRILISQALQYGLTIATVDADVRAYAVPVLPVR